MSDYGYSDTAPTRRSARQWLIPMLLAFVGGLLVMGWMLTRWEAAAPFLSWMRPGAEETVSVARPHGTVMPQPVSTEILARDVAVLEARLDRIGTRADAAAGNAARAEGLLVAFAIRRAIDRGIPLGYAEGLLREQFGKSEPQAVATILTAARQPVTRADLQADLDMIAPQLVGPVTETGWMAGLKRELTDMIVIRRTDLPPATPDARILRAHRYLAADHVERALAEIARLPTRDKAGPWIAKARRYIAAHAALDRIETSVLLTPA